MQRLLVGIRSPTVTIVSRRSGGEVVGRTVAVYSGNRVAHRVGGGLAAPVLPHRRTYSAVSGGFFYWCNASYAVARLQRRLPLFARGRSGSAFAACAEAHTIPRTVKQVGWYAVPCCRSTPIESSGSLQLKIRPFPHRSLPANAGTMASADFCAAFPGRCRPRSRVRPNSRADLPR